MPCQCAPVAHPGAAVNATATPADSRIAQQGPTVFAQSRCRTGRLPALLPGRKGRQCNSRSVIRPAVAIIRRKHEQAPNNRTQTPPWIQDRSARFPYWLAPMTPLLSDCRETRALQPECDAEMPDARAAWQKTVHVKVPVTSQATAFRQALDSWP